MSTEKFDPLDLKVGYLQIGGELGGSISSVNLFFGITVGATHFTPDDGNTEWFFSGTAYMGAKIPITKHLALRTQLRVLGTLIDSDSRWFCVSGGGGGGCVIAAGNFTGTVQGDVSVGLVLAF